METQHKFICIEVLRSLQFCQSYMSQYCLACMKRFWTVTVGNLGSKETVALFTLHESVKYYTKYGAKVFGAFLDASKAFDKVLHYRLLKKLLDKKVPVHLVLILKNWYVVYVVLSDGTIL